jgi:hypothetical protein
MPDELDLDAIGDWLALNFEQARVYAAKLSEEVRRLRAENEKLQAAAQYGYQQWKLRGPKFEGVDPS